MTVQSMSFQQCLIVYIERKVACSTDNKTILQQFQNMKTHIRQL